MLHLVCGQESDVPDQLGHVGCRWVLWRCLVQRFDTGQGCQVVGGDAEQGREVGQEVGGYFFAAVAYCSEGGRGEQSAGQVVQGLGGGRPVQVPVAEHAHEYGAIARLVLLVRKERWTRLHPVVPGQ
ncbi:hypothetical protein AB4039_38050 [Streptomyces sp. M-16]|uniref:hypothetical protein n=1 Tax=Streptomyces sp. M-16 TaxID=3233040 RepID=UPI003F99AA02